MADMFSGKDLLIFDGAMGTMLQKHGMKPGTIPETLNITDPEMVAEIHRLYKEAGADVMTTNTFGSNRYKLEGTGYTPEQVVSAAMAAVRKYCSDKLIAFDMGITGQLLSPLGTLSFDDAYESFKEQAVLAEKYGADLVIFETISDLYEAKAGILAVKENTSLPIFCTMTFDEKGRTLTGTDPVTMVNTLQGLGVSALGLNCSTGPEEMKPFFDEIIRYCRVPVMVQPNAGLPQISEGKTVFPMSAEDFARSAAYFAEKGARVIGGCCGTDPAYIKLMRENFPSAYRPAADPESYTAVSSGVRTVFLKKRAAVIGERINPTGKKKLKEALKAGDMEYVLREAVAQEEKGADILDVNTGVPGIDEVKVLADTVRAVQGIVKTPLQVDSSSSEAIEQAVRAVNGKPLINSVNGKKESIETILPIAAKYGACVLGLAMDENGIPSGAEERLAIARKIVRACEEYGIPREDILIDCLVLTVSAQQKEAAETLKALSMVKKELGVGTVLGASNISFGLPQRKIVNRTFLAMALQAGLDAPITDPLVDEYMDTIRAYRVLSAQDEGSVEYVDFYAGAGGEEEKKASVGEDGGISLEEAVLKGLAEEAVTAVRKLLEKLSPMEVVNGHLIPPLEITGQRYESGEIFLPQLIRSAETVKKCFALIRDLIPKEESTSKGKIVLASVEGDVHDIGKNIVKVLLENYGYEIYDLGRDVPPAKIVEEVKRTKAGMVGLASLMTTTLFAMEETIQLLKQEDEVCSIVVGGAVLTEEYARNLGADHYAADAREAVKIAEKIFGS